MQSPPIAIQWGIHLAPEQTRISDIAHCSAPEGLLNDVGKELVQAIFWKLSGAEKSRCLYNFTLSASDLEVSTPEDRALLSKLLRDRLVLVGANITSTGDLVHSPVHGQIPGVYLHAMALDNLVTLGMDYDREPASLLDFDVNWLDLVEIGLVALIALFKALHDRQNPASGIIGLDVKKGVFFKSSWATLFADDSLAWAIEPGASPLPRYPRPTLARRSDVSIGDIQRKNPGAFFAAKVCITQSFSAQKGIKDDPRSRSITLPHRSARPSRPATPTVQAFLAHPVALLDEQGKLERG